MDKILHRSTSAEFHTTTLNTWGEEGHHAKGCGESHVRSLGELILGLCKILSINCWDHVFL